MDRGSGPGPIVQPCGLLRLSGYEIDIELENRINSYVRCSGLFLNPLTGTPDAALLGHELSLRGIVIGLRTMHEGIIGRRLLRRLFGIFLSLTVLMVFCLIIRTVAGLGHGDLDFIGKSVNLSVYLFLPAAIGAHIFALVRGMLMWYADIKKLDKVWES